MKYLLDTNIISDLMKHPAGVITGWIRKVGEDSVFTSVIVIAEVEYGIEKKQSLRLREQLEGIRPSLTILPLTQPAEKHYARVRVVTEQRGWTIGQNDLLIAAHALSLDAIVVTDDRAFLQMPGVRVENWLR
jgi:tRNA(fMet)-specific endonuclease VapC